MRFVMTVLLSLIVAAPALAQTPAKKAPAKQTTAKRKAAPAKQKAAAPPAAYATMPLAEREAIQSDLIWTGDYNGIVDGNFSTGAVAAVKAFQKRSGAKETGVLDAAERAALATAARAKQDAVGWRLLDDRGTGTRLGLPGKLVPQMSSTSTGTHWASSHGEVRVETFRIADLGTTLATVFEQQRKLANRQIDYNTLKPDFFVISGLQGLKKFYVRAGGREGEVRGVTILYDQAMEGIMNPVVVAMSSAFTAFPTGVLAGPLPKRKVEYGTGIVVSAAGDVVTDRAVIDACRTVSLTGLGNADVVATDEAADLALLRVYGARGLHPVAFAPAGTPTDLTLMGIADPQAQVGGDAITSLTARLGVANSAPLALDPAPGLGFSGAAVIDGKGRLIGMAQVKAPLVAGPPTEPVRASLVPAETIVKFLTDHKIAAPAGSDPTTAAAVKAALVRVICVRK